MKFIILNGTRKNIDGIWQYSLHQRKEIFLDFKTYGPMFIDYDSPEEAEQKLFELDNFLTTNTAAFLILK